MYEIQDSIVELCKSLKNECDFEGFESGGIDVDRFCKDVRMTLERIVSGIRESTSFLGSQEVREREEIRANWISEVEKAKQFLDVEVTEGTTNLEESSNVKEDSLEVYERPCTRRSGKEVLNVEWVQSNVLERKKRKGA